MACFRDWSHAGVLTALWIIAVEFLKCLPEMPAALLHLCHKMAIRAQWWISLHPLWRNTEHLSPKCWEASPVFQGKNGLLEYPETYIPPDPKLRQLGGRIRIFALGWPVAVLRLGRHCPCSSWRKTHRQNDAGVSKQMLSGRVPEKGFICDLWSCCWLVLICFAAWEETGVGFPVAKTTR